MRFRAQHRFHGQPGAVAQVLSDPSFYLDLDLPDLNRPEVLERRGDDDQVVLRLRYEFVGDLIPMARRVLGNQQLLWVQEVHIDLRAPAGTLQFGAERNPKLLHGEAHFDLEPDGGETVRHLEGDLVVAIRGIGGMAERRILPGLLRRLDIEAQALNRRLGTNG
jgi:uncharacterized protein DUF2505